MRSVLKKIGLASVLICLAASPAIGAILRHHLQVPVPSIDRYGNLDCDRTGAGILKTMFNTRTDRLIAILRGHTFNDSKRRQVFRGRSAFESVVGCFKDGNSETESAMTNGSSFYGVDVCHFVFAVGRYGHAHAVAILGFNGKSAL